MSAVGAVSNQLGLDQDALEMALTVQNLKLPGGEEVERKLQVPQACRFSSLK
jgi:hypothetical protein